MFKSKRKLLSQNFLRNRELVEKLVRESSIGKTDIVVEIGSGTGVITEELLGKAGKVIAVEIDKELFFSLKSKFDDKSNLTIFNSDFLTFSLPTKPFKVFSNLPFRITSAVIHKLLTSVNSPEDTYLIVQKEAASKLISESMVSAIYYPWFDFSILYQFHRSDFLPTPNVNTVFLRIKKREIPLISKEKKSIFNDFVAYVFSGKKPYIKRLPNIPSGINSDQWIRLFNCFLSTPSPKNLKRIEGSYCKLLSEQQKLEKIHRTRTDRNWKRYR